MVINTISVITNEAIETSGSDIVTQARPPPEDVSIAVKTFQEALTIEKAKLGKNHPKVLHTLHHLAIALRDNGYLEMAKEHFEEELSLIREQTDGDNRMAMACILTSIGKLENQLGLRLEAIQSYKNALQLLNFMGLPQNHPRFTMTSRILSRLEKKMDERKPV